MRGHIAIAHKSVLGFDQHISRCVYENRAEWMVAMGASAPGDFKRAAQKCLVIQRRHGLIHLSFNQLRRIFPRSHEKCDPV